MVIAYKQTKLGIFPLVYAKYCELNFDTHICHFIYQEYQIAFCFYHVQVYCCLLEYSLYKQIFFYFSKLRNPRQGTSVKSIKNALIEIHKQAV